MDHSIMMHTDSLKPHKNWPIVLLLLLLYIIVVMSDNFKGIFVPLFKADFGVNNTQIGYVLTACLFMYALINISAVFESRNSALQ